VPAPIANAGRDAVRQKAEGVIDAIVAVLTGNG